MFCLKALALAISLVPHRKNNQAILTTSETLCLSPVLKPPDRLKEGRLLAKLLLRIADVGPDAEAVHGPAVEGDIVGLRRVTQERRDFVPAFGWHHGVVGRRRHGHGVRNGRDLAVLQERRVRREAGVCALVRGCVSEGVAASKAVAGGLTYNECRGQFVVPDALIVSCKWESREKYLTTILDTPAVSLRYLRATSIKGSVTSGPCSARNCVMLKPGSFISTGEGVPLNRSGATVRNPARPNESASLSPFVSQERILTLTQWMEVAAHSRFCVKFMPYTSVKYKTAVSETFPVM